MDILAQRLRALRKERGLNQSEVADQINISRGTYASYESGTNPSVDMALRLSDYYGVQLDYLLGRSSSRLPPTGTIEESILTLEKFTPTPAISSSDVAAFLDAAIQYAQSGAPCGQLPLDTWRSFSHSLAITMQAAAAGDVAAVIHHANAATIAALSITQMPALLLTNQPAGGEP